MRTSHIHVLHRIASALSGAACLLALGGCAVTQDVRHQSLLAQQDGQPSAAALDPYPGIPLHLSTGCTDRVRFFMLSVLVPLPPIIPTIGLGDTSTWVVLDIGPGVTYESAEAPLADKEGQRVTTPVRLIDTDGEEQPVRKVETSPGEAGYASRVYVEFAAQCVDLDGATLVMPAVDSGTRHQASVALKLTYRHSDEIDVGYMQ